MENKNKPLFTLTIEEFLIIYQELISKESERIINRLLEIVIPPKEEPDRCRIKKAAEITGYSVSSLYRFVNNREIPYSKNPKSNILWFSKTKLQQWQLNRENKIVYNEPSDFEITANNYLITKSQKKLKLKC